MSTKNRKYWEKFYENSKKVGSSDLQRNVGRTKAGDSISPEQWRKTLKDIANRLSIKKTDDVLELCCGNGEVIGNFAKLCRTSTGVDYSSKLLVQLEKRYGSKINIIHSDALDVQFAPKSFDKIIIYFSIQYFDERETVILTEKCLKWMKQGGLLLIGDVPNELKKWEYIAKKVHKKDYIERLINNNPMVGNWFNPAFFEAFPSFFTGINVNIINQPSYHINSSHRFDVVIRKT